MPWNRLIVISVAIRLPATGSPRYGMELNLPGVRHWRLTHYPYLVFYVEGDERVDVWRVLHEQRDIPAWMRENPSP